MLGAEQRLAVELSRVFQESREEELIDQTSRTIAHRRRHFHEGPQIIVDDHFSGQAELLAIGFDLIFRGFFGHAAVLDLAVSADRKQVADIRQSEAVVLLEIVEVPGRTQFGRESRVMSALTVLLALPPSP